MEQANAPSVFYGICGEGLGHFCRAAFLVPRLMEAGYRVELFTSGHIADLCVARFPDCRVHRIMGFRMHYRTNSIDALRTIFNFAAMGVKGAWSSCAVGKRMRALSPIAVISDYEPVLAWTAFMHRIPVITLDHQQIATECDIEWGSCSPLARTLLRRSNSMTYWKPKMRIITSFFPAPLRSRHSSSDRQVIGPVLRPEVTERSARINDHIVVYQTSRTFNWLDHILTALPGEKRVYGTGQAHSGQPEQPFSEGAFLDDLATCRFAIVNGGHTTISEALYYEKPVLCFPVRGQAEQETNAYYVDRLGFGMDYRPIVGGVPDFSAFLEREDEIRATIAKGKQPCGNYALSKIVLDRLAVWR